MVFRSGGTYISVKMNRRASQAVLFLIWAFWATAAGHAFSMGLGGTGAVTMASGQGFGPKLQYGGGASIELVFPIKNWLRLDSSIDLFTVAPSDASGGFLYRGYSGAAVAVMVQAVAPVVSSPGFGTMRLGGGLGAAGALPSYWYTTLAFFYVEPRAEGLLEWQPAGLPNFNFQLVLPVRMQLRRDMSYSASAGFGITVLYRFGKAK
jgi:hypothetical protein